MNLNTIIETHLKVYGFDGLFCPGECACEIGNLAPCDSPNFMQCRPGFKVPCVSSTQGCECGEDKPKAGECWRIQADKPEHPEEQGA
jgi:hypothetical protein